MDLEHKLTNLSEEIEKNKQQMKDTTAEHAVQVEHLKQMLEKVFIRNKAFCAHLTFRVFLCTGN